MRTSFVALFSVILMVASMEASTHVTSTGGVNVIPKPVVVEVKEGFFSIGPATDIIVAPAIDEMREVGLYLADVVRGRLGRMLSVRAGKTATAVAGAIVLSLEKGPPDSAEGYEIDVDSTGVVVKAGTAAGIFHGVQTLRQLLPPDADTAERPSVPPRIPCVMIRDYPRYPYRGLHLDVGRHFFSKEVVKKQIDLIAFHKMNTLHFHVTEDQGWRIEIKKYPKLTEVGAWRTEGDGTRYGGYFTQDDIREIVSYARSRFVEVIPEIEMPGHCTAALAAYPELSCTGGPFEVAATWGVFPDVYCAGNEKTFEFL